MPQFSGKVDGIAFNVPVPNGSCVDLTTELKNTPSVDEANDAIKNFSKGSLEGIVGYTEDPIVSADIVGNPASCFFDAQLTSVLGNMVKIVAWYDNEIGYSNRLADLIQRVTP